MITLKEQYLYGSKRLGVRKPHLQLAAAPHTAVGYQTPNEPQAPGGWFNNDCMCYTYEEPVPVGGTPPPPPNTTFMARFCTHTLGMKEYELTNHLGNVLATVLDLKTGVKASPTATTYAWFKADVTTAQDYYPFGSLMPGRTYVAPTGAGYRFGFNGMQRDDEIKGPGNSLDFGARMYDSRLGRWMSVDPLALEYVDLSPYNFVANNPIYFVDIDGKRIIVPDKAHQQVVTGYLKDQFGSDIFKFDRSGQLKLDKKAFKAAKGDFNQDQTDIVNGILEVIKSDRVIEVVLSSGRDINFSRNPLEPVEVKDPLTGETKVEFMPKFFGRGYVIPELNSEAKTIHIPGDTKAFILMNIEASTSGVFDAESIRLSGKEAGETGVWSIPQITDPSPSSIFVHELLDHGLDYTRTGSLNEPVGASPLDNVNFHNKALRNKGSKPRTGNDHD